MTPQEIREANQEVAIGLENLKKALESFSNISFSFSNELEKTRKNVASVCVHYRTFDKIRNSVPDEKKVQRTFVSFLKKGEEMTNQIRNMIDSLDSSAEDYQKLDESRATDFAKAIKSQVVKFIKWVKSELEDMDKLAETIKDSMSHIEKQIQKEFGVIK